VDWALLVDARAVSYSYQLLIIVLLNWNAFRAGQGGFTKRERVSERLGIVDFMLPSKEDHSVPLVKA
jgi:hypothetical protein